jgi:predicted ATPase
LGQERSWLAGTVGGAADIGVVYAAAQGSLLVRLEPDVLRRQSTLIGPEQEISFDMQGTGLAGVLDVIRDRGDGAFEAIRDELCELFPSVKYLQLRTVSQTAKALQLELKDGTRVPANLISEGILYFLAFAAIERIDRPAVLLVEEPENGLHPSRIADVMKVLRRISEKTQVVIATHSPLVINEMKGHEVIVLTRDADRGTQARLLKDTYNYEERSRVYQNGELWLSYANGKDESALLSKPEAVH